MLHQPDRNRNLAVRSGRSRVVSASDGDYALTPVSRKWLVPSSSHSLADKILLQFLEWDWIIRAEDYVRTGKPLHSHKTMTADADWDLYQPGMRARALPSAGEMVRRLEVPKGARAMLDIGGSYGYLSVALCRKHRGLRSVVLDLPEAVAQAAPILAAERMGDRVVHRAGDALTAALGENVFRPHTPETGGPVGRPARILLRAHQSVRNLVDRRHDPLAATGEPPTPQTDSLPHRPRHRYPGGRQTSLSENPRSGNVWNPGESVATTTWCSGA
jgi:hypothetical protein